MEAFKHIPNAMRVALMRQLVKDVWYAETEGNGPKEWVSQFTNVGFSFSIYKPYAKYNPIPFVRAIKNGKTHCYPLTSAYDIYNHCTYRNNGLTLVKNLDMAAILKEAVANSSLRLDLNIQQHHLNPGNAVKLFLAKEVRDNFPTMSQMLTSLERKTLQKNVITTAKKTFDQAL